MPSDRFYVCYGGGLGDVLWDFINDPNAWLIAPFVKELGAEVRIHTLCHNDGVMDLFKHNPYISSHINEPWHLPCPEDVIKYNAPIDGYEPLHRSELRHKMTGGEKPAIYLNDAERIKLQRMEDKRPLIVVQPYAGLSDRDAFDIRTLRALVYHLVHLEPNCQIVVVGKNHDREHHYSKEEVGFEHANVTDLIDKAGIRFCYHLVSKCDAFCGSHSNLIRTAWDFRKRNVCVMPHPSMTQHIGNLDPKYRYGFAYPESHKASYEFPEGGDRKFETANLGVIARQLLGR